MSTGINPTRIGQRIDLSEKSSYAPPVQRYPVEAKEIVNCTGHAVVVVSDDNRILCEWPASPRPAHIVNGYSIITAVVDPVFSIPIIAKRYGKTISLPEPRDGVFLIVSSMVADANPKRRDLLLSDVGRDALKSEDEIIAVRRLKLANVTFIEGEYNDK